MGIDQIGNGEAYREEKMIKLQVEKYCQECPDFKAKVSIENISFVNMTPYVCGDTVVSCKYAQRCKNIYERIRFLEKPKNGMHEKECKKND